MEGLLPRVEDFLVKFAGTNETQLGALTKGLVEVGEVVKGLLSREKYDRPYGPRGGVRDAKGGAVVEAGH